MKDILYFNTLEDIKLIDMMRLSKSKKHDYSQDYLTFEALEEGTFTLSIPTYVDSTYMTSVSYSTDNGENWTTITVDNTAQTITTPIINAGSKVLWKGVGKQMTYTNSTGYYSQFSSMGNFNISGNIMSLLYGDEFQNNTNFNNYSNYNFSYIFRNAAKLTDAANLILPATTLTNCCYSSMFRDCTALETAPVLPATTLASNCYQGMFQNCTELTEAPKLSATTLANACYTEMFKDCTSLVNTPELPATTLANSCYYSMFSGCTSLSTAPELPATTLVNRCYQDMFYNCNELNYIKAMFTTTPSLSYTSNWVKNVAATGTFVKNSAATWTTTGNNAVPSGWTVETADS